MPPRKSRSTSKAIDEETLARCPGRCNRLLPAHLLTPTCRFCELHPNGSPEPALESPRVTLADLLREEADLEE